MYREITIKLWGKGVTLRREVPGAEIAAGIRFVAHKQQFILSRIDARNGAFGLAPDVLNGAVLTNDFPIFNLNTSQLLPRYLEWFSKTADFVDLCKAASEGTTNRIRLKEDRFLAATIPLPALEEQRRIVVRIEELAAKIEEARGLRREASEEASLLLALGSKSIFEKPTADQIGMEDLVGRAKLKNGKSIKTNGVPSGIKCLRLSAMRNGRVDCADTKSVPMSVDEASQYRAHPGDVFIMRGNGSKELVGQAGLVTKPSDGVIFPDLFIHVPLNHQQVLPEYFG